VFPVKRSWPLHEQELDARRSLKRMGYKGEMTGHGLFAAWHPQSSMRMGYEAGLHIGNAARSPLRRMKSKELTIRPFTSLSGGIMMQVGGLPR